MLPRSKLVLVAALVALGLSGVLLAAAFLVGERPESEAVSSAATSAGAPIGGPFTLAGTDGKAVTDETYRGKWMLIYFGYTFCPTPAPRR